MRVWVALALVVPAILSAQSRDEEIRLARSAAPAAITKDAKVYVLDNGHYIVADPGKSTEACMVARPMAGAIAPMCGDAEADATIFAVERFRTEQQVAGKSKADIDRAIKDGLSSGRFRIEKRPVLVFMLSSAQMLPNPEYTKLDKFMPHVMVFYPGLKNSDFGLIDSPDMDIPGVVESGTPQAGLVIVERNWIDPTPQQ